jgi:hypothetical protein
VVDRREHAGDDPAAPGESAPVTCSAGRPVGLAPLALALTLLLRRRPRRRRA